MHSHFQRRNSHKDKNWFAAKRIRSVRLSRSAVSHFIGMIYRIDRLTHLNVHVNTALIDIANQVSEYQRRENVRTFEDFNDRESEFSNFRMVIPEATIALADLRVLIY